jgi:hypothetical protein
VNLPYVHADWHTTVISNVGGTLVAFAGSDGGLFSSTNVFSAGSGSAVTWNYTDNRGIASHLFYSIASGDPTTGDQNVVFGGLQDNGTRFRDLMGSPTTFNQVIGGDGIGTALVHGPNNTTVFWASLPQSPFRLLCKTDPVTTCSQGSTNAWINGPSFGTTADPEQFFVRYAEIDGDAQGSLLTATTYRVYKLNSDGSTSTPLTPAAVANQAPPLGGSVRNIVASPFTHTDCGPSGGQSCRLYGVALSGGKFVVITDTGAATPSFSITATELGDGTNKMKSTTSIAFPSSAAHFKAGAHDGQVFIVGSTAPRLDDGTINGTVVVPDATGRIFLTTDGGTTYTPFHGNGTSDLPNVPVQVIVFDPSDTTDSTIFVGNDLGVYQTTDMGKTWQRYGVGFPLVRVTEIRIAKNSGLMRVGTYGRGLWEIYPNAMAAPGVRGDGDWDRNLAIDFLDLGATASRLGDTPATTTQPYYDWHVDVTGTAANSIAEDDLTAVLGKFGSHP